MEPFIFFQQLLDFYIVAYFMWFLCKCPATCWNIRPFLYKIFETNILDCLLLVLKKLKDSIAYSCILHFLGFLCNRAFLVTDFYWLSFSDLFLAHAKIFIFWVIELLIFSIGVIIDRKCLYYLINILNLDGHRLWFLLIPLR